MRMKHLANLGIVLIMLIALFVPQMGEGVVQLTQGWNQNTVSAGAHFDNSTGAFQHLDQRIVNDNFDGAAIDSSVWNTSTGGAGTVTLLNPLEEVSLLHPLAADAAMLIRKSSFDPLTDEFRFQATLSGNPLGNVSDMFVTFNSIAEPTVMSSAAFTSDRVITAHGTAAIYVDNGGSFHSHNGTNWVAGPAATLGFDLYRVVMINFDDSGTMKWKLILFKADGTFITTAAVAWSATRAPAGGKSLWFNSGTQRTDAVSGSSLISDYQEWGEPDGENFLTASQIVNTGTISFEEDFNSDDIQVLVGNTPAAATECKVYVQEDAGAFGSAINVNTTILAGETGWHDFMPGTAFSNHSTSVTLKLELNTPNSDLQLKAYALKIKGVTIAGGGGADDKLIGGTLGGF